MLGQPFDPSRYFLFLALLALLATIGAALGLMVGSLVKDVQQGQHVRGTTQPHWKEAHRVDGFLVDTYFVASCLCIHTYSPQQACMPTLIPLLLFSGCVACCAVDPSPQTPTNPHA